MRMHELLNTSNIINMCVKQVFQTNLMIILIVKLLNFVLHVPIELFDESKLCPPAPQSLPPNIHVCCSCQRHVGENGIIKREHMGSYERIAPLYVHFMLTISSENVIFVDLTRKGS